MTRAEALDAMKDGKKIKHAYFSSDEWMKISNSGGIEFEDGCKCSISEFFNHRQHMEWNDGWSVVE